MTTDARSAFEMLGVPPGSTESEIRAAWRLRAQQLHPDAGGSHTEMIVLNAALHQALLWRETPVAPSEARQRTTRTHSFVSRDVSSFTINDLPVVAFETLTVAAAHCGQVTDEECPYLLEFTMHESGLAALSRAVCRCELMPEAGGTTVHLSVTGAGPVPLETVRDMLVGIVNEISH